MPAASLLRHVRLVKGSIPRRTRDLPFRSRSDELRQASEVMPMS